MWEFCEPSFYTNGCVRALVLLAVACLQKKGARYMSMLNAEKKRGHAVAKNKLLYVLKAKNTHGECHPRQKEKQRKERKHYLIAY